MLPFFLSSEVPAVVVGVVGMGHVPGIERNWDKELNIHEIMRYVPTQLHVLWYLIVPDISCQKSLFLFLLAWLHRLALAG